MATNSRFGDPNLFVSGGPSPFRSAPQPFTGPPIGGSSSGAPGFPSASMGAAALLGGVGSGLNTFFQGRQQGRNLENQFNFGVAQDEAFNPNRPMQEAFNRNFQSNFMTNLGIDAKNRAANNNREFTADDFLRLIIQSGSEGINPLIAQEGRNVAGVPGFQVDGQRIGQDPRELFKAKTPGLLESIGSGFAGLIGG